MKAGMVLLTGGRGSRMGEAKHGLAHPLGVSWGRHLVEVFRSVFPDGPIQLLGNALPDEPGLVVVADPRQGPAVALRHWAQSPAPLVDLWWVAGCDQVRWNPEELRRWNEVAQALDPGHARWILARWEDVIQPLGGWLPHGLRPALAGTEGSSMRSLIEALPHHVLPRTEACWSDVDTPEERARFEREGL